MISLEKLCFNLIVREFERFHFAFTVTDDENLKWNFKCLQRIYTYELGSQLALNSQFKEEYLDLLFNEHLEILDKEWFRGERLYNWNEYRLQKYIYRLPNLKNISLAFYCNDEVFENIAKYCPKVVEIDAFRSSVTDIGIMYLCKSENGKVPCPELRKLILDYSQVTDEGLTHLIQNLPSLEKIFHKDVPRIIYSLHKGNFYNLGKLPSYNLVHLQLFEQSGLPYYTDLLKICLTLCPRLTSMRCSISEKEQLDLFNNTNLEELELHVSE